MTESTPEVPQGNFALLPHDQWGLSVLLDLARVTPEARTAWNSLLEHVALVPDGKPSARWLKTGAELIRAIPAEEPVSETITRWLANAEAVVKGKTPDLSYRNASALRGLVLLVPAVESEELIRQVSRLTLEMYRKIPGIGPRSLKLGNAGVHALGGCTLPLALARLAWLKSRIKLGSTRKEIEKALVVTAGRMGLSLEDLEEIGVPTFGLTGVGTLSEPLGDFTAEMTVNAQRKCELVWRKPDGKLQKAVPASVKEQFPEELKDLKAVLKDVEQQLPVQRDRLDNLFTRERRWPTAEWRERYLDHPVVGVLARQLVWEFTNTGLKTTAIWNGEELVNVDDEPVDWLDADGTVVQLWHPIGRPMDDVLAWRGWLERHEVRQPFKQAHREIYVLTAAEVNTRTYSNRYAAHILKQHQFNALCSVRGWKSQLRLMVDASYSPPTRAFEQHGLRVEYWVEPIGDQYGTDTTDSGSFLYLSSDQVRFYRLDADENLTHAMGGGYEMFGLATPVNQPLPLDQIPPLVFSEAMRDIDLFVGVASVGNDPTWQNGGPEGRFREYWEQYSFGDLSATAETRKQVLQRLIPRLKIASRCSFEDRFLRVRGDKRTYRIHLGSGNILMEPNDQYLCIVPDSSFAKQGDKVFLPFEGDRTLSIILSKAMLLADDLSITDRTILAQLEH